MQEIGFKVLEILIFVLIGLIFCIIGYKFLARNKNYNLDQEIDDHNTAAGIMVAGYFIAMAIIMSGVL